MLDMGNSIADDFIEEGRAQRSREVSLICIQEGLEDSLISKISKLSLEEVAEIRAEVESSAHHKKGDA
jgi:hypothetical protein